MIIKLISLVHIISQGLAFGYVVEEFGWGFEVAVCLLAGCPLIYFVASALKDFAENIREQKSLLQPVQHTKLAKTLTEKLNSKSDIYPAA
jgi:ABC-type polysaccharide/polyol phosphate export permease